MATEPKPETKGESKLTLREIFDEAVKRPGVRLMGGILVDEEV